MLLNCIRRKSVTSWRSASYPVEVLSLPFSEDACQRCRQRQREGSSRRRGSMPMAEISGDHFLLRQDDPIVPPPPTSSHQQKSQCPFPSSAVAALPPKPQSPQPPVPQLSSPVIYCQAVGPLNDWTENSQPPRPARSNVQQQPISSWSHQHSPQRANLLLQQLRTEENPREEPPAAERRERTTVTEASPAHQICVFLEHQGETKRSALPPNLRVVEQLKSCFLRSFPSLNPAILQSASVKVYIQKPDSPHGLFYELEDLHDLADQSVLRLFEQSPPSPAPPLFRPPRPAAIVEPHNGHFECLSDPETLGWSDGGAKEARELAQLRPASVLGAPAVRRRRVAGPSEPLDWGGHSSDSSSCSAGAHYPKSGSSTPREDREETRRKVDSLERQLGSLCSLVHSALFPRAEVAGSCAPSYTTTNNTNNNNTTTNNNNASSLAESTTSTLSTGALSNYGGTEEIHQLSQAMGEIAMLKAELDKLRREAQRSAQSGQEMIQRTLNQIRGAADWTGLGHQPSVGGTSSRHLERLANVQSALRTFEASLENTRSAVLNSNRRLKLDEVDELAARLGEIGRETVKLKVEIPGLQRELEAEMRQTVEKLAAEECMLRDKLPVVDVCLRRCKTLANMMVTLKKLAIIHEDNCPVPTQFQRRAIPVRHISLQQQKSPSSVVQQQPSHPLDAILDELNSNTAQQNEISARFTLRLGPQQKPIDGVW